MNGLQTNAASAAGLSGAAPGGSRTLQPEELKCAVLFTKPLPSFIHSFVREVDAVSFSHMARVCLLVF